MPVIPDARAYPTASRSVIIPISLAPTDTRAPWTPAPAAPLARTAVVTPTAMCFGAIGGENGNGHSQCECSKKPFKLRHRCISGAVAQGQTFGAQFNQTYLKGLGAAIRRVFLHWQT
jgi:hypothetical protein